MQWIGRLIGAFLLGFLGCLVPILLDSEWQALPGGLALWVGGLGTAGFVLGLLLGDPLLRLMGLPADDSA